MKNYVFCTDYGCRTIEQNYECHLIKYNVKFYTKPILSCFLILPLFLDEILMLRVLHQLCKVPIMLGAFSSNYANFFLPVSLFRNLCETVAYGACAVLWGNGCERLCMLRPLLGSYVHQESI